MGKLKSHSGAKKRVRRTGSGKLMVKRNSRNHLLMQKNKSQKRRNRGLAILPVDQKRIAALVPHL